MTDNAKLSEVLRPQHLDDLTLPRRDIERLKRMLDSGNIMNMILYGRPGLGKTSAARVITKHLEDYAEGYTHKFNGSSGRSAEDVRKIAEYASCGSLIVGPTIVFIDEADFLSPQAQASLRYIIENATKSCRFLFTANDIRKFSEAIRSRMKTICFDIATSDRGEVMDRLIGRYREALPKLGIGYEDQRLKEIVGIYFPDLRAIANEFEYEFGTGVEQIAA